MRSSASGHWLRSWRVGAVLARSFLPHLRDPSLEVLPAEFFSARMTSLQVDQRVLDALLDLTTPDVASFFKQVTMLVLFGHSDITAAFDSL